MSAIMASTVCVKTMADDTLRLTIDIDPQYAGEAFALFGKRGVPCAIARLTNESAVEAMQAETVAIAEEKPKGGPLAKLAGIWCNDRRFWDWIAVHPTPIMRFEISNADDAAKWVRDTCFVQSRAELDNDKYAETRFHTLIREPFAAYMREIE